MNLTDIRGALETQLLTIAALPTVWENTTYIDTGGGDAHQVIALLPATPQNIEMGKAYLELGIFQVTLNYPLNKGPGDITTRAQLIRDAFPKNQTFQQNGGSVLITNTPAISQLLYNEKHVQCTVRIKYNSQSIGA